MIWNLSGLLLILLLLILAVSRWKIHPFLALLLAALSLGLFMGLGGANTVDVLLTGFGNTLKWIGVVVILGAFIGEVLHETGGALRISKAVVKRTGPKKLPWAMGVTGYLVSIPVFVDVAYIVLQPVTEALAGRSKRPVLVLGLALAAGLTVSHTLIPPTPGPLAVASLLNADIGRLILINGAVAIFAMAGGILWATYFCKNAWLDYDRKLEIHRAEALEEDLVADRKQMVLLDLLPIIVPIVLMAVGTGLKGGSQGSVGELLSLISTPMVAVLIGAGIAWLQFRSAKEKGGGNRLVEQAIVKSALVIMITGAGGAFGFVIRESGIQNSLADYFATMPFLGFLLPFLVAAVLTTATGSVTVSLIGAASIVGPMVANMSYSPEMIAALIGCGSFCVFHANSSFFWLLNRLHEVPVPILYQTFTTQSLVMGLSGLLGVFILQLFGVS